LYKIVGFKDDESIVYQDFKMSEIQLIFLNANNNFGKQI